jgi:multiple sugar transport system substrate-binding protein
MGVDSSDSFYSFLTYMDAHNVKVVDDNGKLTVDQPEVKKGLGRHRSPTTRARSPRAARRPPR